jgi:hypothetical protein
MRYLNPEKKYFIKTSSSKLRPLDVFIEIGRLDDLIWEDESSSESELLDWISFFEGQRAGKIHLIDQSAQLKNPQIQQSSYVKSMTSGEIAHLKQELSGQKDYRSLQDKLYSKDEVSSALPTV